MLIIYVINAYQSRTYMCTVGNVKRQGVVFSNIREIGLQADKISV